MRWSLVGDRALMSEDNNGYVIGRGRLGRGWDFCMALVAKWTRGVQMVGSGRPRDRAQALMAAR